MFNDRDMYILGGGALGAVFCLFLPIGFVGKIVLGFTVLAVFMAIALMRLGSERIPLEEWLRRRIRYAMRPHDHVYQQRSAPPRQPAVPYESVRASAPQPRPAPGYEPVAPLDFAQPSSIMPLALAFEEVGVYPLMTLLLAVLGAYFVYWLANGGAGQLALMFR